MTAFRLAREAIQVLEENPHDVIRVTRIFQAAEYRMRELKNDMEALKQNCAAITDDSIKRIQEIQAELGVTPPVPST